MLISAREWALEFVIALQNEVNAAARAARRPEIDMLNTEEIGFIRQCHVDGVWPDGWEGDEPTGDQPFEDGGQTLLWPGRARPT